MPGQARLQLLIPGLVTAILALEVLVVSRHPAAPPPVWITVAVGAAMLVALGAAAYWAGWRPAPDGGARRLGIWLGVCLGLFWTVEIGVNNVYPADRIEVGARDIIDDVIWATIWLLTLGIAVLAARRAGRMAAGASVGLWSGIVSGLLAYLAALLVAALFLVAPQRDPELIAGFPASGYPDLATDATFSLIGSPLGGAGGHLWLLGVTAGTLLGALGGFVGLLGRRSR